MTTEAWLKLLCPECGKHWEKSPHELPAADDNFSCPDCHATRKTSEFMHTDRDLRTLKQLS